MNSKSFKSTLFLSFILAISLSFPACSDTHAESQSKSDNEVPGLEIPELLARNQALGSASEQVSTAGKYDELSARLKKDSKDAEALVELAALFVNEARITGEHPHYYPAALSMLNAVPEAAMQDQNIKFQALHLRSSVQLSLHDFKNALATGKEARNSFPHNAGLFGVLVDANVELGDYEEAVKMADQMVALRPDLRSYSRVSYLREIHGEVDGAIEAMKMAVDAGMPGYEQTAWCRLQLAQLYERYGKLDFAAMHYNIILEQRPEYPFAYEGLASIEAKNGNIDAAMELLDKAIALIPEVSFYAAKASLLMEKGEIEAAMKLKSEILEMMAEDEAAGHSMDLEFARVHLTFGMDVDQAMVHVNKALSKRPDNIDVNALLARVWYEKDELEKAALAMEKAMHTGTKKPEYQFLAGLIMIGNEKLIEGKKLIKEAFESNPYASDALAKEAKKQI